jgi:DNA polymerase-3 subunit epsilon
MVKNAPTYSEVMNQILEFIDQDLLVAHNASFDIGVLVASAKAINQELPKLSYGCSLKIARKTYNLESYRLNAVAYAIGHEEFEHHNALADSDACARIVIHAAARHGVQDLPELLVATKVRLGRL